MSYYSTPERTFNTFPCRYRGAGTCTVDDCKSHIYFTSFIQAITLNKLLVYHTLHNAILIIII